MKASLINLLSFKAAWFAAVLLAARDEALWGTACIAAVVLLHLARVVVPVKEALFLVCAGLIGLAWETTLVQAGLLSYPVGGDPGGWAPYWIVALWVLFATTIGHGFRWIKRNWMLSAGLGLIGGPLSFAAGAGAGAVVLVDPVLSLVAIGVGWALLLPLLALVSDTLIDSAWLEPDGPSRRVGAIRPVMAARSKQHV